MISTFKTSNLPIHIQSIGIILIIAGIWNLFYTPILGIGVITIAAPFILIHQGIAFDDEKHKMKEYFYLLGFKIGKWENIDDVKAIQIIELEESQRMWVSSISRISYEKICKLYLSLEKEHILLMKGSKKKLMPKAEALAKLLKIDLYDKTEG